MRIDKNASKRTVVRRGETVDEEQEKNGIAADYDVVAWYGALGAASQGSNYFGFRGYAVGLVHGCLGKSR